MENMVEVFINPFTDFGFKRIFGQEDTKCLLISFLNALFEGECVIKDLEYRDKEQIAQSRRDRCVIYDIYCTLADGRQLIVEMQNKKQMHFDERALYYASRSIDAQGRKGDRWVYGFCPVIGVYFMNFCEENLGYAYRSDFGITNLMEVFSSERLRLMPFHARRVPFANKLRMVFLQLPRFDKTEEECHTSIEKWMYLMKNMNTLTQLPWTDEDEVYAELAKVSNVAALSPEERIIYDENLRIYRDNLATNQASYEEGHEAGVKEGHEAGVKEGHEAGVKDIINAMRLNQVSDEDIAKLTGLTIDEVEALK